MNGNVHSGRSRARCRTGGVRYFTHMVRPAQTARSERTREALRQAAVVRFLAQGVEETSAEQIAADAGVSLRTFYRHFASKHDLLFADYDAGLHWFRAALAARSPDESIIESVQSAIMAWPYDDWAVTQIAALRAQELDPGRIVRHIRQVEADFAEAIEEHLAGEDPPQARHRRADADHRDRALYRRRGVRRDGGVDARRGALAARARPAVPATALETLSTGIGDSTRREVSSILTKLWHAVSASADDGLRRDRRRRGPQRTDRGRAAAEGRAAHAVPGLQALRRRNGLDRRAVRRLPVRDRRLGADPDVGGGQPRTRARRPADRRPRRDVGVAARRRRRTARSTTPTR